MNDSKQEEITGRVKEAAGVLTGDEELEQDGERDQQAAEAKSKVESAADSVKDGIDDVKDKLSSD